MMTSTFLAVLGTCLGLLASVFLSVGTLQMSAEIIVRLSGTVWDYNQTIADELVAQRTDFTIGMFVLVASFILQVAGALAPNDRRPRLIQPASRAVAVIVVSVCVVAIVACLWRHSMATSLRTEVMHIHQDRLK